MKASELVVVLNGLIERHGDMEVMFDGGAITGLYKIDECDLDIDDTGFILWPPEGVEPLFPGEADPRD